MSASLYSAILAVMREVGYVQKKGRVQGGGMNYRFAGEADLLAALRPSMVEHGLVMLPLALDIQPIHEMLPTKYGDKPSRTVRVVSTYRLAHESGEHIDIQVAGEGQDKGDKATAKAMTIALKYALRQSFLIETGDDPDMSRPEADYPPRGKDAPLDGPLVLLERCLFDRFGPPEKGAAQVEAFGKKHALPNVGSVLDTKNTRAAQDWLDAMERDR